MQHQGQHCCQGTSPSLLSKCTSLALWCAFPMQTTFLKLSYGTSESGPKNKFVVELSFLLLCNVMLSFVKFSYGSELLCLLSHPDELCPSWTHLDAEGRCSRELLVVACWSILSTVRPKKCLVKWKNVSGVVSCDPVDGWHEKNGFCITWTPTLCNNHTRLQLLGLLGHSCYAISFCPSHFHVFDKCTFNAAMFLSNGPTWSTSSSIQARLTVRKLWANSKHWSY